MPSEETGETAPTDVREALRRGWLKAIADAANCDDAIHVPAELLAEVSHMNIDVSIDDMNALADDVGQQFAAGKSLSRMRHEKKQQTKLRECNGDRVTVDLHGVALGTDGQSTCLKSLSING